MHTGNKFSEALKQSVKDENAQVIIMNNSIEAQIAEMEDPADQQLFMEEYKMAEPALNRLIRSAYTLLNLYTYFTAGVQEVRAWTIHEGWKAPQAASVIHTDFEKGFIKAEVISYDDFIQYGSEAACRENGRLRIEGKEYVVKDGDWCISVQCLVLRFLCASLWSLCLLFVQLGATKNTKEHEGHKKFIRLSSLYQ